MSYGSRYGRIGSRRNGRVASCRRTANGGGFPRQRLRSRDARFSSRGSRMRLRSSLESERLIEFADRYGDSAYEHMDDSNHFEIWIGEGWAVTYADAFKEKTPGQWLIYLFDQQDQLWECCGDYGGSCEDMFMRYYLHFDPRDDDPSNAWDYYAEMEYGAKNESLYIADKDPLIELEAVAILLSMKEGVNSPQEAFEALKALDRDCREMGYL